MLNNYRRRCEKELRYIEARKAKEEIQGLAKRELDR
jgi:hypothetical protein